MLQRCTQKGFERVLVADDIDCYRRCREVFIKPPEMPRRCNTPVRYGCPCDCGLCPDHEQHSYFTLVELCDTCNLDCPICYAQSGIHRTSYRSLEQIECILDAAVANELQADVVQISDGRPTLHPDFFSVLDAAKRRPICHLMLNTNGIRIARANGFAERPAEYMPEFEIYLQFDSLQRDPPLQMRGDDLERTRLATLRQKTLIRDLDIWHKHRNKPTLLYSPLAAI